MITRPIFALALAFVLAATLGLSACNTLSGAGQDLKAGGQAVENTADKTKPY